MSKASWKRVLQSPAPRAWALEARLMFDAAAAADVVHQVVADAGHDTAQARPEAQAQERPAPAVATLEPVPSPAAAVRELVFIDAQVENQPALLASLREGVTVIRIDGGSDPWAQMTQAIARYDGLTAIHVISHGAAGEISLGGQTYRTASLQAEAAQLQQWQPHLAAGADLLLYGCDVGAGAEGATLLATLSQQTGADVAGSTNITGSVAHGGDWVLEASTGSIEAKALLSTPDAFDGTLVALGAPPGGSTWHDVMIGSNYDPANDQQANSKQDVVGDATYAMMQSTQDASNPSNPVYYFR
ncbi:MAG TPA: DUF4347 domain-containing protein, partial [Burkholderiaceae bacterium]|nr:DUF4347 domain-containing protein [Burkholderiaceae bacterium]